MELGLAVLAIWVLPIALAVYGAAVIDRMRRKK